MHQRPKIVILGAGYGGLSAAHKLQYLTDPMAADITLIDRHAYHVNTINLHEVAMGNAAAQDISFDIVPIIRRPHARVVCAEITAIDIHRRQVVTDRERFDYDFLVIGLGFVPETFGIPGMQHAFQIASIEESERISMHLEDQFRHYCFTDHIARDPKDISILVGGSGFTGVELLGEIVQRLPSLCKKYGIEKDAVRVMCVSADRNFLPMFQEKEAAAIRSYLEKKGVVFHFDAKITKATKNSFVFTDATGIEQELFANTLIWTGGVSGSPLMDQTFTEGVKRGRIVVHDDLTIDDHPEIYVVGDCAVYTAPGAERPAPTTAQIATQMGYHAAINIAKQLKNRPRVPFKFSYKGTVCSLGSHYGLADLKGMVVNGFIAMRLKRFIEAYTEYKIAGLFNAVRHNRIFKLFHL